MKRSLKYLAAAALLPIPGFCTAAELALTPESYRDLALKNNSGLRQVRFEAQAAEQSAKAAFTHYFPNLSAAGLAANTNILPNSALTMPIIPAALNGENNVALSMITIQQPLFAGGRIHNGNRLARAGRDAAALQLRLSQDGVITGAERKYRTLRVLAQKKKTLEAYAALLDALSAQVEQAFSSGLVTKTDVLRVNLKKAEVAVNRSILDKSMARAEKDVKLFADIPQDTEITLPDVAEDISEPSERIEDLPASLSQRPEYKLLEIGARAANLQTKMKRGEYLPVIGVGASLYRVDYFKGGDQRFQNSAAFGLINMPLSSWWEASHSIKEMRLKEAAAADRLKERGDSLLVDLEDKLKNYDEAYQRVKLAELAVEESAANRSEKQDGYKNGTEKLSDLLEALALEQQSADSLVSARADYFRKRAEFLLAIGRFPPRGEKTAQGEPNAPEAKQDD
ncbi:MAG: TolC family protein [Elusimicrobiales bacterium]|nr:TolC family protein [Elusimicrobiales bacterium]